MIIKLYEKILEIIKKEYKFLISLVLTFILLTIEFPYYINKPGGLINLEDRITIQDGYKSKGSMNLAYVSEIKATIPTLIISLFNDNWDVIKKEEVININENEDELYFRERLLLDEANDNAIILGFKKAGEEVVITNSQIFITYVDSISKTDLKIGDQILKVDNIDIENKEQLYTILASKNIGDIVNITVLNDNKTLEKEAIMIDSNGTAVIGIMISEKKEYEIEKEVNLNFPKSEFGPSGGLMTSLAIYDYLTIDDLTKGKIIVGTGTIDLNGNVGSIGGVEYKLKGAIKEKADIFLVPSGENYKEAIKIKQENNYDIEIIPVSNFDEALDCLGKI